MSPRQYKKFFEKLGFTDVCLISEVWMTVREEVDKIFKQNGLPLFTERKHAWESPNFLELASTVEYCVETFAEKKVIVFQAIHKDCPAVFTATINAKRLTEIVENRKFHQDLYIYWPGHAVLYYAYESKYYDRVSPICAKVFKGQLKSQLLEYSEDESLKWAR